MKAGIWIAILAVALVLVSPMGAVASEAASCREEARSVNVEAQRVPHSDVNDAGGSNAVFSDGAAARPECDAHDNWAGPVGWWWNQLYYGLFNSNAALMWLFGWEVFLGASLFAIGTGIALLTALFSFLSIPFRHRTAG